MFSIYLSILFFCLSLVTLYYLRKLLVWSQKMEDFWRLQKAKKTEATGVVHSLPPRLRWGKSSHEKEILKKETGVVKGISPAEARLKREREFRKLFGL